MNRFIFNLTFILHSFTNNTNNINNLRVNTKKKTQNKQTIPISFGSNSSWVGICKTSPWKIKKKPRMCKKSKNGCVWLLQTKIILNENKG